MNATSEQDFPSIQAEGSAGQRNEAPMACGE